MWIQNFQLFPVSEQWDVIKILLTEYKNPGLSGVFCCIKYYDFVYLIFYHKGSEEEIEGLRGFVLSTYIDFV
jgi:hypothetical protein